MDYITWRIVYTVLVFVLFIGIIVWAYGKGRKSRFDEAAQSIFRRRQHHKSNRDKAGVKQQ